jgi:hypothetical protein
MNNADYEGFEGEMARAEQLAHTVAPMVAPLILYSPGSVYEEYASSYARMGKLEKSHHYLQLAEKHLPTNNLWDLLLKATRAEVRVYSGEITQAMPLLIEVAHLAQMYGHQRMIERLYRLQYYLDDQSSLMRQASRSLGEILHGPVER